MTAALPCPALPFPIPPQDECPQGQEGVDVKGVHGRGVRPAADLCVQGQQETSLLRGTPVKQHGQPGGKIERREATVYTWDPIEPSHIPGTRYGPFWFEIASIYVDYIRLEFG